MSVQRPDDRETLLAMSAYLVFLMPLIFIPDSRFAMFHANQGLLLLGVALFCHLLWLVPRFGWLLVFLSWPLLVALAIRGIIAAARGECKPLPGVGKLELLK
ncbi:MAG: hypothetical protein FH749_04735 [Firmicutes bacterium]|nr:hypothetical protein [Bacillota bacterium]